MFQKSVLVILKVYHLVLTRCMGMCTYKIHTVQFSERESNSYFTGGIGVGFSFTVIIENLLPVS